jgi:hypothetical protein
MTSEIDSELAIIQALKAQSLPGGGLKCDKLPFV